MRYEQTTQVPNILFDIHLPDLKESELKLILIIIRQTNGWVNTKTGARKTRDRISHSQFIKKTGLSRRIVGNSIKRLIEKNLMVVSDRPGNVLSNSLTRKGVKYLYYSTSLKPMHNFPKTCAKSAHQPVQIYTHNKTNYIKLNKTKVSRTRVISISDCLEPYIFNLKKLE